MDKQGHSQSPPRITLRDIAQDLGVSHTTVSLALRNHSRISDEQRDRICKRAKEMGYRPDPMLSALSSYRLKNQEHPVRAALAWINPWPIPEKLRTYHEFDLYWKGASETAFNLGYHLEEFTFKDTSPRRLEQVLIARNIRGILIPPIRSNIDWGNFNWSHFPVVRFGRNKNPPNTHFASSSQVQNTLLAFDNIWKKGYRRIGFVGEKIRKQTFGAGFFWAQQEIPPRQRLPLLLFDQAAPFSVRKASLAKWLDANNPDSIFTTENTLPQMLTSMGLRIPEDIALAASSIIDIPIDAGIDQNSKEIGRTALLALISLINDSSLGIPLIRHEHLITGHWVDGSSLPSRQP